MRGRWEGQGKLEGERKTIRGRGNERYRDSEVEME